MKKLAVLILAIFLFTIAVSAADIPVLKYSATLDGAISENEYPAQSAFVLDKKTVDAYGGCWAGEMTDAMGTTYRFTWDDKGLYMVCEIKDDTVVYAQSWDVHGADGGPAADGVQLCLFAHDTSRWLTIGSYANGDLAPRKHYDDTSDLTGIITGKATRAQDSSSYVLECLIPWECLNLGDVEIKEGIKIPLLFTYMDRFDGGENCYKTLDAATWPPSDQIDNFLVLGGAYTPPAPETEPAAPADTAAPAEAATTAPVSAAQTSDTLSVIALAAILAVGCAIVVSKRKNH